MNAFHEWSWQSANQHAAILLVWWCQDPSVWSQRECRIRDDYGVVMMHFSFELWPYGKLERVVFTVQNRLSVLEETLSLCVWQLAGTLRPQWNVPPCLTWSSQALGFLQSVLTICQCKSKGSDVLASPHLLVSFYMARGWLFCPAHYLTFRSVNLLHYHSNSFQTLQTLWLGAHKSNKVHQKVW